jgi:hypothetical protein
MATPSSYYCACAPGFAYNKTLKTCVPFAGLGKDNAQSYKELRLFPTYLQEAHVRRFALRYPIYRY